MLTTSNYARRPFYYLVAILLLAALLGACADEQTGGEQIAPHPSAAASVQPTVEPTVRPTVQPTVKPTVRPTVQPTVKPTAYPLIPQPLNDPTLDLRARPVDVPLELRIPSLQINAPVLGVGITAEDVMDAPQGLAADPVWQKAFWYRGSSIPGDVGTATFAGHVDDAGGRPAVFARLNELRSGDLIVVYDTRSGLELSFTVVKSEIYSAQQATDPAVLAQVYGSGPVEGLGPQPALDGLAHLTLITCAGSFVNGTHDHRLVVYATRSE